MNMRLLVNMRKRIKSTVDTTALDAQIKELDAQAKRQAIVELNNELLLRLRALFKNHYNSFGVLKGLFPEYCQFR